MAKTIWNVADRQSLLERVAALTSDAKPLWGKMSVAQMTRHCALAMQAATGELVVKPKVTFFRHWPMPALLIYWLPWPPGAPTAPELLVTGTADFAESQRLLQTTLERFAARGETATFAHHAAFGVLSRKDWGALTYRHIDHHLRQFGA